MSVIRIKKARNKPYVILDTTALNDARLSFRAKGLHTYLMAKPDDWQVHIEHLEKQSPREARDAIRGALQELEACGYVRRVRVRGAKGRMMGWDTTIYETPLLAKLDAEDDALMSQSIGLATDVQPKSVQPKSVQPKSVQPKSANPQLLINDFTQYGKKPSIEKNSLSSLSSKRAHPHLPASPSGGPTANGFEEFWQAYPKKIGKGAALKTWQRLKPDADLTATMLQAIAQQRASPQWSRDGGQFIPHPSTWLNQQRWEDEVEPISQRYDLEVTPVCVGFPWKDQPHRPCQACGITHTYEHNFLPPEERR